MQALLKDIYKVVGVLGAWVCDRDGAVLAQISAEDFEAAQAQAAARVIGQTFRALDTTGHAVEEVDLSYGKGRLLLKNLRGGVLAIVCARNVNLPLLNLTASVAVQKLSEQLKPAAEPVAPTHAPSITLTPTPPLIADLEREIYRIDQVAQHYRLRLRVMGALAVWQSCPHYRSLLEPPENKVIELAGALADRYTIELLGEQLGYRNDPQYTAFYNQRRLSFADARRELNVYVFLDRLEMYHKLELLSFFEQAELRLPATALWLTRLQMVELTEPLLREMSALILEHDLGVGLAEDQLDVSCILRLCADDWGWFKTASLNLDRLMDFAAVHLAAAERERLVARARRLKHSLESAPKSWRWLARARVGASARWYDTPLVFQPNAQRRAP